MGVSAHVARGEQRLAKEETLNISSFITSLCQATATTGSHKNKLRLRHLDSRMSTASWQRPVVLLFPAVKFGYQDC